MWAVNRCTHVSWETYFFSCLFMNLPLTSSVGLQTIMSVCKCSPLVNQAWDELFFRVNWVREQRGKLKGWAASIFNKPEIHLFEFSSDNTEQKMKLTWEMLKTMNYAKTKGTHPVCPILWYCSLNTWVKPRSYLNAAGNTVTGICWSGAEVDADWLADPESAPSLNPDVSLERLV